MKQPKNKKKNVFVRVKNYLLNSPLKKYRISLSTQIIFTIFLVFVSFFLLQSILNSRFFNDFYTRQEFEEVNSTLDTYVTKMNSPGVDYYNEMVTYTTNNNVYSVISNKDFGMISSSYTDYSISIESSDDNQIYQVLIPDSSLSFSVDVQMTIEISPYNSEYYSLSSIIDNDETVFERLDPCEGSNCTIVSGTVLSVSRPNNLNYKFIDNSVVQNELYKLTTGEIDLSDHVYNDSYWYKSTDNKVDVLVFIHNLNTDQYIITIVPVEDTSTIIGIIIQYNYYVYLTAIAIIFLWSFRLSAIISKPIQHIDVVAKEIANLNFDVTADEYNNKETSSLSNSMNLISNNLKDALNTLNNKNIELNTLYEEQSKQVELKKQLVSSISHELKTPLMIMQVIIQGLIDGIIDAESMEEELSTVLKEITKSSMMIQDMLQIYRLDDSNTPLEIERININKEIKSLMHEFDQIIQKQSLTFEMSSEKDIYIDADKKLIQRVLSNFLTNTIKYTPTGETVEIILSLTKEQFTFEIINHGVTIDSKDLKNIWLPFYRGSQISYTSQTTGGSGIGLYLVKEILIAHKASFGIENMDNAVKAYFTLKI